MTAPKNPYRNPGFPSLTDMLADELMRQCSRGECGETRPSAASVATRIATEAKPHRRPAAPREAGLNAFVREQEDRVPDTLRYRRKPLRCKEG